VLSLGGSPALDSPYVVPYNNIQAPALLFHEVQSTVEKRYDGGTIRLE
jgi:hypothetical protein